jgi:hypothetical protein
MKGIKMENNNELTASASALAQELMDCGHDYISALDMLDALASTGLKLVADTKGEATSAYVGSLLSK